MANSRKPASALVIFDLDGTLIDSRRDIAAGINEGLAGVAGFRLAEQDIFPLIGKPLSVMFDELLPDALTARKRCIDRAIDLYRTYYHEHCIEHSRIYDGVIECLESLHDVPTAIATTKVTAMARRVADQIGLNRYFDLVHGTDDIPHKPDPTLIHQVLDALDKKPEQSWLVGDTVYDIEAGKAAGVRTCAVTYGIGTAAELKAAGADLLLDNLSAFRSLV